jgi:hypothetical protein
VVLDFCEEPLVAALKKFRMVVIAHKNGTWNSVLSPVLLKRNLVLVQETDLVPVRFNE